MSLMSHYIPKEASPAVHAGDVPMPGPFRTVSIPAAQEGDTPKDHEEAVEGDEGVVVHGAATETPEKT